MLRVLRAGACGCVRLRAVACGCVRLRAVAWMRIDACCVWLCALRVAAWSGVDAREAARGCSMGCVACMCAACVCAAC